MDVSEQKSFLEIYSARPSTGNEAFKKEVMNKGENNCAFNT